MRTPLFGRRLLCSFAVAMACGGLGVAASAPEGAIFTTLPDGARVNYNIYPFKSDVYLDGGPGDRAPLTAAGLPDGRYVFQVTDPSGKILLSVDPAGCREFDVTVGVMTRAVPDGGCEHAIGTDQDHGVQGARTVQLCGGGLADPINPAACFKDTPNPGGEYKVWVTPEADYLDGCAMLGKPDGLGEIDCGARTKSNVHGFNPRSSKTDNFKVGGLPREIDTRFFGLDGTLLDGMLVTWTDPLGASNNKYSYENVALDVHHEAHVEDVEIGTHQIAITNQPGCTVGTIYVAGKRQPKAGPQTVSIMIQSHWSDWSGTVFVDVYCQ